MTIETILRMPNPFLKIVRIIDNDRLIIIHTDDIGTCQAAVQAFKGFG